jgi:hypothetical protein
MPQVKAPASASNAPGADEVRSWKPQDAAIVAPGAPWGTPRGSGAYPPA